MKRRPPQSYYRPGSGSLRKSNSGIEESESDTNLLINSKHHSQQNPVHVDSNFRSEGNSPRNDFHNMDSTIEKLGDVKIKDVPRKTKKPDIEIYVPRPVALNKKPEEMNAHKPFIHRGDEASEDREIIGDNDRNSHGYSNGNDRRFEFHSNDRFNSNKPKRYSNTRRGNDNRDFRDDWNEKSNQGRQVNEIK
ncbi:hypothetical protein HHI36_006875 [Cryptolaemus montrouzieri]|uniref:Uncharacterized protein n=1 Tax=Cryptolaemus montrouzieri TaxID=559131 RepID=A0ABD2MN22_9CUCU